MDYPTSKAFLTGIAKQHTDGFFNMFIQLFLLLLLDDSALTMRAPQKIKLVVHKTVPGILVHKKP